MSSTVTKIRAILIPVGAAPLVIELDDALKALQAAVGGFFELAARFKCGPGREADVWVNDDDPGLLPNRLLILPHFQSVVVGPMVITAAEAAGTPESDGETYSLTPEEIAFCLRVVSQWPVVE